MNIEEAIKKIKEIIYWSNGQKAEYIDISFCTYDDEINCEEFIEAIETILNELDKNTEIISDLQNEVTIKDAEIERLKEYEYMYKDLCN